VNAANNARPSYGSLAEAASKLPVPANVPLKDPKDFRLVGKPTKRLDTPSKVNARATFGIDVRLSRNAVCGDRALPGLRRKGRRL